jgi:uncharacterized protein YndB with AHSA1/START domain
MWRKYERAEAGESASDPSQFAIALGGLRREGDVGVLSVEMRVEASADQVWSALTDPGRLAQWYGEVDGDLRAGGQFHARLLASGWEGTGDIEACEAPMRLVVTSKELDQDVEDRTEVTLVEEGDHTFVIVVQRGVPLGLLAAYATGMQIHVEDLADHLSGLERREALPRFDALEPVYRAMPISSE